MKRRWIVAVAGMGIALLFSVGYAGYASSLPKQPELVSKPNTVAAQTCDVEQSASAPGNAVLNRDEAIQMPADGRLSEILAYAGQKVKAGQVLARLADVEKYQAVLAAAELALVEAQRGLQEVREQAPLKTAQAHADLLQAQEKLQQAQSRRLSKSYSAASQETIDIARANTMLAKIVMDQAEEAWRIHVGRGDDDPEKAAALSRVAAARADYNRAKANLDALLNGPSDLDISQADNAIALAEAELTAAEEAWDRLKDGPDALLIQQAQAKVAQAEANRKQAQAVLNAVEVRAPFDGIVSEVKVRAGENISVGTLLFSLIDPNALEVEVSVTEEDLPLLREGMAVNLFFDALPDSTVAGKIKSIIPLRQGGDSPRYKVRIALNELPEGLADGMSADASIVLDRRSGVLCLPRGIVRSSGNGRAVVDVWNGTLVEKRTLTVGLRGDKDVEILDGIREGEEVVVK